MKINQQIKTNLGVILFFIVGFFLPNVILAGENKGCFLPKFIAPETILIDELPAAEIIHRIDELAKEERIYVFDIDGTIADRSQPIDDEMAGLLCAMIKDGIVIKVVTGKAIEEIKRIGIFEPLLAKMKQEGIEERITLYTSNGAGKFYIDQDGNYFKDKGYDYSFTGDEIVSIMSVLTGMERELDGEYSLSAIGIDSYIEMFGNRQVNFSPYGKNSAEYKKGRKDRQEIANLIAERLEQLELNRVECDLSGQTTILLVRKGVSKAKAVLDILKDGKVVFSGDEVFDGNDEVVGKLAQDRDDITVVALDSQEVQSGEAVIYCGGQVAGAKAILRRIVAIRQTNKEECWEAVGV